MKKLSFKMMAILLLGVFVFASCSEDDEEDEIIVDPVESNTIVDVASGNDDFSILVDALVKTGLDDALANEDASFTVFAPTNDAFVALLDELGVSGLDDIPNETLTSVLLYHVLNGEAPASAVSTGYYSTLSAGPAEGYNLSLYVNKEDLMLNSRAEIVQTDVMADNGVIHVIDQVVLPLSITGHAVANADFASLAAAVTKAGLADALADESALYTVFAPVNSAFDQLLSDLGVTLDDLTADDLTPILLYHVVDAFVPAADVASGYVPTLSPAQDRNVSLQIGVGDGVMLNGSSNVVATDVVATNGIIHAIDEVVLPPTVVDVALDNPDFSILVEAVVKAELVETLNGDGPFTVFAPVNAAFEELFTALGVSGIDDIDVATLTNVLLAHVVSGNVASTDLSNGSVATLNETKNLEINTDNGVVIDGDINVVLADVQAANGIVHVIDKVIVPE
ncbi:transforming growth factor-beta-induced protein [Marinilabilia salmonicolor]|jgi:transforming growth factor-beta-induced protein|uniref:fasciclin domain-containing protein n=1 Tax=Marinilabilia salmonicolor TaxID=989 RepID=UPI000D06DD1D|nr:fasciclin domain-containing protein [Marinilabilia salmonicolor]PRY87878.1 transforming growth factor-beta-induced protein [Marinilabilia salmonicolor]